MFHTSPIGAAIAAGRRETEGSTAMVALLLFLLLVAILFGAGAAFHALWWVAIIALVLWAVGFLARPAGGRWYRW
jgi:hypothetical protein